MTFEEYCKYVENTYMPAHPLERKGQAYWNVLEDKKISIARDLWSCLCDPFYQDAYLDMFLAHVALLWARE